MECVDIQAPIAWDAPLNRGLLRWWLCLPNQHRGNMWRELSRKSDAAINGATVVGSRGRPGGWGGYQYNGSSNAAQASAINLSAVSTLTFSCWLWWDAYGTDDDLLLETSADANLNQGALFIDPNMGGSSDVLIVIQTTGSGNFSGIQFARTNAPAAQWNHWIVTMDRSAGAQQVTAVYINGVAVSLSNTFTHTGSAGGFGNYAWNFMSRNNGASLQAAGKLDDVRLYNRVLRASEAVELYRASKAGYPNELRWLQAPRNSLQAASGIVVPVAYHQLQTQGIN